MTDRRNELYRGDYLNNMAEADFATLPTYQSSFRSMPKLSDLRLTIAPGTLKYPNQNIPQWVEVPSTITQTEGDHVIHKPPPSCEEEYDYLTYTQGYKC